MLSTGFEGLKQVELWYVQGIIGTYYERKMLAERAAWMAFPDETASERYSRIYYKTFMEEVK
jgi:hypothetical protein